MGFFGTGPLENDDALDFKDELFGLLKVKYDKQYNIISSKDWISKALTKKQNKIYDWLKEYKWEKFGDKAGIKQQLYAQALAQIMIDYNININKRGLKNFKMFIKNDFWAKEEKSREKSMNKLLKSLKEHEKKFEKKSIYFN